MQLISVGVACKAIRVCKVFAVSLLTVLVFATAAAEESFSERRQQMACILDSEESDDDTAAAGGDAGALSDSPRAQQRPQHNYRRLHIKDHTLGNNRVTPQRTARRTVSSSLILSVGYAG